MFPGMSGYKILSELGKGGMGVVYRALHPDLNREVAIKFLQATASERNSIWVARFKREMAVLIRLSHPNIIKVYDAGEADGRLYYVMELVQAKDLLKILRTNGPLALPGALRMLDQLLDALGYIHSSGIIHRDIKPANIVIEDGGRAILMDFGVVHVADATVLTQSGNLVGTPRYFSPELIRGGECSPASDLWSLGVVAYEAICGSPPFDADSIPALAAAILSGNFQPLGARVSALPAGLSDLVGRFLERDPARRWATAGEARDALRSCTQGSDLALGDTATSLSVADLLPAGSERGERSGPAGATATSSTTTVARMTGRSSTIGARTTQTARLPPRPAARAAAAAAGLAAAGLATVIVLASIARRRPPVTTPEWPAHASVGSAPATAPAERPTGVRATLCRLDRLRVEFETARPGRWAVDAGHGIGPFETELVVRHRVEASIDPWNVAEEAVLVSGAGRVRVPMPPPPKTVVRRLMTAIRDADLTIHSVDVLWKQVRDTVISLDPRVPPEEFGDFLKRNGLTAILDRFAEAYVRGGSGGDGAAGRDRRAAVGAALAAVRPLVSEILLAHGTPESTRAELLLALTQLDVVDATMSSLGHRPAFGVQELMSRALVLSTSAGSGLPRSSARRKSLPLAPAGKGITLFPEGEDLSQAGSAAIVALSAVRRFRDRASSDWFTFQDDVAAGTDGKAFHIALSNVERQVMFHLTPPGARYRIPLRIPDGTAKETNQQLWLTVHLRGALASRTGTWRVTHTRAFKHSLRLHVFVDQVMGESAGVPRALAGDR
jgi:serine/threonine protein kinase